MARSNGVDTHDEARPVHPASAPSPRALPDSAAGCERQLWGSPSGLRCIREAAHVGGHVYHDPHGSDVDDRHVDLGHG